MSRKVCESQIDGEYKGWDGHSVYRLVNGQIWQQASYRYMYRYAYRPRVTVIEESGRYMMYVEGEQEGQHVKRVY